MPQNSVVLYDHFSSPLVIALLIELDIVSEFGGGGNYDIAIKPVEIVDRRRANPSAYHE
jgi:hypothetical protein